MLNSAVGYQPPKEKKCFKSRIDGDYHWMDWTEVAGMRFYKGKWYYNGQCNGECLKSHVSLPEKERVGSGLECHNPRCSGSNPSFLWDLNQKLYCAQECIDGYQEWQIEVRFFYPLYPNHKIHKLDQWLGIMAHLYLEQLLTF